MRLFQCSEASEQLLSAAPVDSEAMDCSDKWGEDVEVAMDVDVSNQLDAVIETVHATRSSLVVSRPSELEDFGISEVSDRLVSKV